MGSRCGGARIRLRVRTVSGSGWRLRIRSSPGGGCKRHSRRRRAKTLLEVGPGTGYYTLSVADRLGDAGALHIFDLQQEMLDHTVTKAGAAGLFNVHPQQGDARALPYPDDRFDAAYLVAVLGEISDQRAALAELRRVVKPSGRVVVGELFGDPHMVTAGSLRRLGTDVGLEIERRVGPPFGYFGVLRRSSIVANSTPT